MVRINNKNMVILSKHIFVSDIMTSEFYTFDICIRTSALGLPENRTSLHITHRDGVKHGTERNSGTRCD